VRAWRRAGFVDIEERDPDDDHTAAWLLMEFREDQSASGSSAAVVSFASGSGTGDSSSA
jgi:hypothetical protein